MSIFSADTSVITFLGVAIISQCLFSIIYLSTYNWKQNRWLVLGFSSIFITVLSLFLGESGYQLINTHLLDNPAILLIFPVALYFYTAETINIPQKRSWKTIFLFFPFLLLYLLIAIVGLVSPLDFFRVKDKLQIFVNISLVIVLFTTYAFFSWKILRLIALNQKKYINEFADSNVFITLNWIKAIVYVFMAIVFLTTIRFCLIPWADSKILPIAVPFSAILAIIYILSFFAFRQPILYGESSKEENLEGAVDAVKTIEQQQETLKSKKIISDQERKELAILLEDYMTAQKPYLDPKIRMPMLASALNVSTNIFSYLINEHYQVNFFSFINEKRIKHAAVLLKNEDYSHYTLEAIGRMSGFNSRSTFNSRFKEFHGKTPKEHRDNC